MNVKMVFPPGIFFPKLQNLSNNNWLISWWPGIVFSQAFYPSIFVIFAATWLIPSYCRVFWVVAFCIGGDLRKVKKSKGARLVVLSSPTLLR